MLAQRQISKKYTAVRPIRRRPANAARHGHFPFETLTVPLLFRGKTRFFRSLLAGRRCAASRFTFLRLKRSRIPASYILTNLFLTAIRASWVCIMPEGRLFPELPPASGKPRTDTPHSQDVQRPVMRFIRSSHSRTTLRPGRKDSPARTAGCVRSQEREREREREREFSRPPCLSERFFFPGFPACPQPDGCSAPRGILPFQHTNPRPALPTASHCAAGNGVLSSLTAAAQRCGRYQHRRETICA